MLRLSERVRGLLRHRKRLAPLLLGVGVLAIGAPLMENVPRETDVHLDLGVLHERISSARITYERDGTAVQGVVLEYQEGAPRSVQHTADLAPGRYLVRIELRGALIHREVTRALLVPADGEVHFRLGDEAAQAEIL